MRFYVSRTSTRHITDRQSAPIDDAKFAPDGTQLKGWVVDVETLDDLVELVRQQGGQIILSEPAADLPEIEIYDDYRE